MGVSMECSASPTFAELVMAGILALGLWSSFVGLALVAVYAGRERIRAWLAA